jgi:acetyl esterase/lipase
MCPGWETDDLHRLPLQTLKKGSNMPTSIVSDSVVSGIREFLETLNSSGGTPIEQLSPKNARQVLVDAQNSVQVDLSGIERSEKTIDHDGNLLKLHIVRPADTGGDLPVLMFFHGGGWVLGDYPTHERLVRDLVVESGAMAVFPDYTPSPEAHYPTAIEQAYAATRWVGDHGGEIGADGTRLAAVGNSVGGNMAAVVSLMAKDRGRPAIRFQALLWPVTDANFDTASYKEFAEGHFLTRNMMIWFWDNYAKDPAQRSERYASPLRAPAEALRGLPPALVQTAHSDVLRDEGESYARRLNEAGVEVVAVRYNGLIHDWGLLNPIATVPEVRTAITQAASELRKRLR